MIIEDKFQVAAPIQDVWDLLMDIPSVSKCMPGVDSLEQVDDTTFQAALVVKVGPIKSNFKMTAVLVDIVEPNKFSATAKGRDKNTGSMVSATFTATLSEIEANQTEVAHVVDAVVRGRLGQFGQAVIRETAKEITALFVACLQEQMRAKANLESGAAPVTDGSDPSAASIEDLPKQPSLVAIAFRAIITSIRNWIRNLTQRSQA